MLHTLFNLLGLTDSTSTAYLFWSGIGGYITVIISGIYGYAKLKAQRERHHQQLKDHIDLKFSKLTEGRAE